MHKLLVLGVALALAAPAESRAQFSLGARVGFAYAIGDALNAPNTGQPSKMSDGITSQVPIQLDAMFGVSKQVGVGAYLSYGFGQVGTAVRNDCSAANANCSTDDIRIGVEASYSFQNVGPRFVPWAGLGIGYEWGRIKQTGGGGPDLSATLSGWEFLNVQVGGEYVVNSRFAIGPYLMLSIAQYSSVEVKVGSQSTWQSIGDKTLHEWIGIGIRGRLDL